MSFAIDCERRMDGFRLSCQESRPTRDGPRIVFDAFPVGMDLQGWRQID